MNFYTGKDLADSFRTVRKNTIVIANDIPEDKYDFRPSVGTRTVGELLSHIALAYSFQYQLQAVERRSTLEGFDFPSLMQRPRSRRIRLLSRRNRRPNPIDFCSLPAGSLRGESPALDVRAV